LGRPLDRAIEVRDEPRGGVDVLDEDIEVLAALSPLGPERGLGEVQAADQRLQPLEDLAASTRFLRVGGDVLPAVPHVRHELLDAGVARLTEGLLDEFEGAGLGGQLGAVRVLGVPTPLEEGVADTQDVTRGDAGTDSGAGGEEGGNGAATDRLQVSALAGVAL